MTAAGFFLRYEHKLSFTIFFFIDWKHYAAVLLFVVNNFRVSLFALLTAATWGFPTKGVRSSAMVKHYMLA